MKLNATAGVLPRESVFALLASAACLTNTAYAQAGEFNLKEPGCATTTQPISSSINPAAGTSPRATLTSKTAALLGGAQSKFSQMVSAQANAAPATALPGARTIVTIFKPGAYQPAREAAVQSETISSAPMAFARVATAPHAFASGGRRDHTPMRGFSFRHTAYVSGNPMLRDFGAMPFDGGFAQLAPVVTQSAAIQPAVVTMALPDCAETRRAIQTLPQNLAMRGSTDRPDVFGTVAISVNRTPFDARWSNVRASALPAAGPWAGTLRAAATLDRVGKIDMVNRWVNAQISYAEDSREYGRADHWATAQQSLSRRRGDCEDYAIAKHAMLRALGIAEKDMFLVIARDLVRRADHAVLAVKLDDRIVILDNETNRILDEREVRDYRPVMSYAAGRSWTHGYRIEEGERPMFQMASATAGN